MRTRSGLLRFEERSGLDAAGLVDLEEHRLALSMVLAVEVLHASLSEEGLPQWWRGDSGPLEAGWVVKDTGGLGAGHAVGPPAAIVGC